MVNDVEIITSETRSRKGNPLMHLRGAGSVRLQQDLHFQATLETEVKRGLMVFNDTQTGMPLGIPKGARCVQRFDDSLNSAIHITYRISLRSSSMREPRDPLLKVLTISNNLV